MDERLIREVLSVRCPGEEETAMRARLARLGPDVARAAARLRKRREERRQGLVFLSCALAFLLIAACGYRAWALGSVASGDLMLGGGALMGVILILSPLMAYCVEREREHEKS